MRKISDTELALRSELATLKKELKLCIRKINKVLPTVNELAISVPELRDVATTLNWTIAMTTTGEK